ncbi:tetratricopeptide repeat protein [Candidatus Margulisiibacteriota bacterium]
MKKKILISLFIIALLGLQVSAKSLRELAPENIAYKAGPTGQAEELAYAWVEALVYPKKIETGGTLFIEVGLTGKANAVAVEIDDENKIQLSSSDKLSWSGFVKLAENVGRGVHLCKATIIGKSGKSISRTLAFRVAKSVNLDDKSYTYDVTVSKNVKLGRENLKAGEKIEAISRKTFYWIRTGSGKVGWLNSDYVKEPIRELYISGYESYASEDYDQAAAFYNKVIDLDNKHTAAHYWLAKTYSKSGEEQKAIEHLTYALALDPNHAGANWIAARLAREYYRNAQAAIRRGDLKIAETVLNQVVALRPASNLYRLEQGKNYQRMGQKEKARYAWKQVLLNDPENRAVHALLNTDYYRVMASEELKIAKAEDKQFNQGKKVKKPNQAAEKYVAAVKKNRTKKGTTIAAALKSVVSMTKSLGTRIIEEGWKTSLTQKGFLVSYVCRQERLGKFEPENFVFKVDLDSNKVSPWNKNAKLLMLRW